MKLKRFLIECKIGKHVVDELLILAFDSYEAEEKLRLHNKDNPLQYVYVGEFQKNV